MPSRDGRVLDPAVKSSLLWGIVGGMAFLVLIQAYHLLGGEFVGIGVMVGVALLVTGITAVSAHVLQSRLAKREATVSENETS